MAAKKTCLVKLKKEMKSFLQEPPPFIPAVAVNESDILEWHFLIEGPDGSPYEGGWYVGKIRFPADYPFKPPAIMMLTASGRFKTGTRLCLSMSDFHPETWNPMWSVASVLTGLLSFMLESTPTTGSIETSDKEKEQIAVESGEKLLQNPQYRNLFPDLPKYQAKQTQRLLERQQKTGEGGGARKIADIVTVENQADDVQECRYEKEKLNPSEEKELAVKVVRSETCNSGVSNLSLKEGESSGEKGENNAVASSTDLRQVSVSEANAEGGESGKEEASSSFNSGVDEHERHDPGESFAESAVRNLEDVIKRCQVAVGENVVDMESFDTGLNLLRCGHLDSAKQTLSGVAAGQGSAVDQQLMKGIPSSSDWANLEQKINLIEEIVADANSFLQGKSEKSKGGDPLGTLALLGPVLQETCPRAPHFMFIKACALLAMGELESSIKVLESALVHMSSQESSIQEEEISPITKHEILDYLAKIRTALRHRSRGNDFFRKKNYSLALKAYDNALQAEESCVTLHYNRATVLTALQRHEEALSACERALEIFNTHTKSMRRRGDCLVALGRNLEAIEEYSRLLAISPDDSTVAELLDKQQRLIRQ